METTVGNRFVELALLAWWIELGRVRRVAPSS